jgi:acyl carrier protein
VVDGFPQNESAIAKQVIEILAAKLNRPASDIGLDDDLLRDLGIDSLVMAELTVMIEQQVGRKIRGDELIETQTVGDVVRLLTRRTPAVGS